MKSAVVVICILGSSFIVTRIMGELNFYNRSEEICETRNLED